MQFITNTSGLRVLFVFIIINTIISRYAAWTSIPWNLSFRFWCKEMKLCVCVYLCVCVCVCVCVCISVHVCVCLCVYERVWLLDVCVFIIICVCICLCLHVCAFVFSHMCMCVFKYVFLCACARACVSFLMCLNERGFC